MKAGQPENYTVNLKLEMQGKARRAFSLETFRHHIRAGEVRLVLAFALSGLASAYWLERSATDQPVAAWLQIMRSDISHAPPVCGQAAGGICIPAIWCMSHPLSSWMDVRQQPPFQREMSAAKNFKSRRDERNPAALFR